MRRYEIDFKAEAREQLSRMEKYGRKTDFARVDRLITEMEAHPRTGTGHPKPLRGHKGEVWARKVNEKDRLVYEIFEEEGTVLVTQVLGHYGDR